jgi:hypothetical protein
MVNIFIYIDDVVKQIDLFDDEKISVTSSVQNINDISKLFTDYSQTFTIPASDNNNEIFKHWYENSLDNGYDQRIRYDGYIEIDTQKFRVGKWQLEDATVKNNRIEDYKLTFYGELKSLTDKFGEDKLKDIQELNDYTLAYTGANVKNSITSTSDLDVMFPLISSDRPWVYGTGGTNDISVSTNSINYTELFPALKLSKIFDAIQSKYNVVFNGTFLQQDNFTRAYLFLKNSDVINNFNNRKQITFANLTQSTGKNLVFINDNTVFYQQQTSTLTESSIVYQYSQMRFNLNIEFASSVSYVFFVERNGNPYINIPGTGTTIDYTLGLFDPIGDYTFYIQTDVSVSFDVNHQILVRRYRVTPPIAIEQNYEIINLTTTQSISGGLDLTANAPDIKVGDFISGILKMFNLTAFSADGVNFTFEQLENWYFLGDIKDFTQYTITDTLDFKKIKPYRKIRFEYTKSESVINRNFANFSLREYGDLTYTFNNDGSDYSIKLPFENLLFTQFFGTTLNVGFCLKTDLQKYIPKPIILYRDTNIATDFWFNTGSGSENITNYNVMGQVIFTNGIYNTLNWGIERNNLYNTIINNTLFNNFYFPYLNNLYLLKSRMLKVKMRLPYLELLNLKLNDRIVIRDKRYIINQFTTDLTTYEVDMELIHDFRKIIYDNNAFRQLDSSEQTLVIYTTSTEADLEWTTVIDVRSMIDAIRTYADRVEIDVNENTTTELIVAVIENKFGEQITIEQDA